MPRKASKSFRVLTLRISLEDTSPEVWREIAVVDTISFHTLHQVIQAAMGWDDAHLYLFYFKDLHIGLPDPQEFLPSEDVDSRRTKLNELIQRTGQRFQYQYDFGDSWRHEIKVVKTTAASEKPPFKATLLDGANACPPEDCGGMYEFEQIKMALADPELREEALEWGMSDFTSFDLKAHKKEVERI